MQLNLHILKEDLKHLGFQGMPTSDPTTMELAYPLLVRQLPESPDPKAVYIIKSESLPETLTAASILCIGTPPKLWQHTELLYSPESVDALDLLAEVTQRFHYYSKWTEHLQQAVCDNLPIQEMADCSGAVVGTTLCIYGSFYRVLGQWFPKLEDTDYLNTYIQTYYPTETGNITSPEEINELISDAEYNNAIHTVVPTIYPRTILGYHSLYLNIIVDGTVVSRILFDELGHPFTGKDFALITVLGTYLKMRILHSEIYAFERSQEMEQILHDLLANRIVPEIKISTFLNSNNWHINDTYVCIILKMQSQVPTSALLPLALPLSRMIMQDCYVTQNETIIFVCNLTQLGTTRDKLYATILPYLRDNLLTAGISTPYRNFKNLYYYYQQATLAEALGKRKDPSRWYFKFEEYQLDYMVHKCTENTIAEVLIPEGLKSLMEYDQQRNHNYTQTLRLYLRNDRNIAKTIREAYMHRSTFLYQIKRIQEILKMDLDDPEVRLLLLMAFHILDA